MNKTSGYDLTSKAMLVCLTVKAWGGQRLDRDETDRVTRDNGASKDALRVTKDLVGDKLDGVRKSERAMRQTHRLYTLPWDDGSTRLLPTAAWEDYQAQLTTLIDYHKQVAVPAFIAAYVSDVIPAARQRLGSLFREEDFPDDIGSRFGVTLRYLPVPTSDDVRVGLSAAEVAALRDEVETATREAYEAANRDIVERATKPLERLAEALRDYIPGKSRLSKALLENVSEIADLMPKLDVTGSPVIASLAEEIAALAGGESADRLAINGRARLRVASAASALSAKLTSIL